MHLPGGAFVSSFPIPTEAQFRHLPFGPWLQWDGCGLSAGLATSTSGIDSLADIWGVLGSTTIIAPSSIPLMYPNGVFAGVPMRDFPLSIKFWFDRSMAVILQIF